MEFLSNTLQNMKITTYKNDPFLWEESVSVVNDPAQNTLSCSIRDFGSESDSGSENVDVQVVGVTTTDSQELVKKNEFEETEFLKNSNDEINNDEKMNMIQSQDWKQEHVYDFNVVGVTTTDSQESVKKNDEKMNMMQSQDYQEEHVHDFKVVGVTTTDSQESVKKNDEKMNMMQSQDCQQEHVHDFKVVGVTTTDSQESVKKNDEKMNMMQSQDCTKNCFCHKKQWNPFGDLEKDNIGYKLNKKSFPNGKSKKELPRNHDDSLENITTSLKSICLDEDLKSRVQVLQVGEDVSKDVGVSGDDISESTRRKTLRKQDAEIPWTRSERRRLAKRMKKMYKDLKMTPQTAEEMLNDTCYIQVIRKILELSGRQMDFDFKTFHCLALSQNFEHAFDNIEALNQL